MVIPPPSLRDTSAGGGHIALFCEGAGIDPFFFEDGPEVFGQAFAHVVVGQPAVALFAPAFAPGVADEQGAGGFGFVVGVFDFHFVVIAHGDDGMSAFDLFF